MVSLRRSILQALVDALGLISVANGYNSNVAVAAGGGGAQKRVEPANKLEKLPALIVGLWEEDKDDAVHSHYQATARVMVGAYVRPANGAAVDDLVEDLVEDVEKALFALKAMDPALGVSGVQDLKVVGHTKFEDDGQQLSGAMVEVEVLYRHSLASSGAY